MKRSWARIAGCLWVLSQGGTGAAEDDPRRILATWVLDCAAAEPGASMPSAEIDGAVMDAVGHLVDAACAGDASCIAGWTDRTCEAGISELVTQFEQRLASVGPGDDGETAEVPAWATEIANGMRDGILACWASEQMQAPDDETRRIVDGWSRTTAAVLATTTVGAGCRVEAASVQACAGELRALPCDRIVDPGAWVARVVSEGGPCAVVLSCDAGAPQDVTDADGRSILPAR